jgi:hypothetical protein
MKEHEMTTTFPQPTVATAARPTARTRWPLIGVAAGVLGVLGTLAFDLHVGDGNTHVGSAADVARLSQTKAHLSIVCGFLAVALLLAFAAAWRTHVEPRVPNSVAARLVSAGFTSAAGALALGYGWKGALAVYLPGGSDDSRGFDTDGLYVLQVLNDFGSFIGWLGVTVGAAGIAWMALRERTVSRWIGVVSLLPVIAVVGMVGATGLPGFPGVVSPIWLVVTSLGLYFGKSTIAR